MKKSIAVIGGGPAGLIAGIIAGRQGADVTLLEAQDRIGKKILATGNGKCNLTNTGELLHAYNAPQFVRPVLDKFGTKEALAFFREIGLLTVVDGEGRVYPRTKQATGVLNCLRGEVARLGVNVVVNKKVEDIKKVGKKFVVDGADFDAVILATGGANCALARALGHTVSKSLSPSLSALVTDKQNLVGLDGKRVDAIARLQANTKEVEEKGEVLFRANGLSGIAIFNLSAYVARGAMDARLTLDVVPELTREELKAEIARRDVKKNGVDALEGLVDRFLAQNAVKAVGRDEASLSEYFKAIPYEVKGVRADGAQVTSGGVTLAEVGEDMQSKLVPGLYFAGEVLDVDGLCGGYNLQWAWSSGYVAGEEASRA